MTQNERLLWMADYLKNEHAHTLDIPVTTNNGELFNLWRALVNIRPPVPIGDEYLTIQDEYLSTLTRQRGIVQIQDMEHYNHDLFLWRGDITRINADAIVNAANSGMTGCYRPCHVCIDNCIHTFAGVQLREECGRLMRKQQHEEAPGQAKITAGYNLPAKHVIHTVGPIVQSALTAWDTETLAGCYSSCLGLAAKHGLSSIAFCCIATGEFHFPSRQAAITAVRAVRKFLRSRHHKIQVIFNVFKKQDYEIYRQLLNEDNADPTDAYREQRVADAHTRS